MSANIPGSFDPNNPFSSTKGGQFDPGAIQGLYLRASKGDLAARKYLQSIGFLGAQGEEIFSPADMKAGDWGRGVNAWAAQTGSTPIASGGFQFNPGYINESDPTFSKNWDKFFDTGGSGTDFAPAPALETAKGPEKIYTESTTAPASPYGTTYKDPGGGWNPWSLYDGRQGFNGTAVDGWYDQSKDRPNWQNNGQAENDRNRVWRWVFEATGGNPGGTDPTKLKQIFLDSVARLKRDYLAPENVSRGLNWANSAFANYDKMPGAQTSTPTVVDPKTGQPTTQPTTPQTNPDGTPKTATYTNPVTGQTTTYDPASGSALQNLPLADPQNDDARLAYVMRKFGLDPTRAGLYTGSIARALSPQIEAASQLNGLYGDTNAIDTARSNLDDFVRTLSAPGGFGALQQHARGLLADPRLAGLASGLGAPQQISTLQTLLAQAYAGGNAIYNQSRLGRFNQALGPGGEFAMQSLDNPALNDPLKWLQSTEWADMLRGY